MVRRLGEHDEHRNLNSHRLGCRFYLFWNDALLDLGGLCGLAASRGPLRITESALTATHAGRAPVGRGSNRRVRDFLRGNFYIMQSQGDHAFDHVALALTDFGHVNRDGTSSRQSLRRDAPDRRLCVQISFLLGGSWYWGRSRQLTGAPPRRYVARIAPYARPETCRHFHRQRQGFQTVPSEPKLSPLQCHILK
jgi:hypothetical protein